MPETPDYSDVRAELFDTTAFDIKASPSRISSFLNDEESTLLLPNFLLAGSTQSNSLDIHDSSVRPGNGLAHQHYLTIDADEIYSFFDQMTGWGGTSASTAMLSGIVASLWSVSPEKAGSSILEAMMETANRKGNYDLAQQGMGQVNPVLALDRILND